MTLPLKLYRLASRYIASAALPKLERKMEEAGLGDRLPERRGHATQPRPAGKIFWLHGASVGEGLSLLALAEVLIQKDPALCVLLTTGTIGGARVISPRCTGRIQHQFAPLDSPDFVKRFLAHWQPQMMIVAESELWPNTLLACHEAGIPMALVNARLSANSRRQWNRMGKTIAKLLGTFALIHVQDRATFTALKPLASGVLIEGNNLKSAATALPYDSQALEALDFGMRPHWLAASTHKGEEELILAAHQRLLTERPDLLLVLVPRHTERADDILGLCAEFTATRRSLGEAPTGQVYLADTFGEMGLWLRKAPFVVLGGSFVDKIGGHNPWEPAALGKATLSGPYVENAAADYDTLEQAGAALRIAPDLLAQTVAAWLDTPEIPAQIGKAALTLVQSRTQEIDDLATRLLQLQTSS